jgi:two-component sensor histidine kinase/PAS domain-containing protein
VLVAEYVPVGQSTVDKLARSLLLGESTLIIGPYYGGKTYLLDRLRLSLRQEALKPVYLQFYSAEPVESAAALREQVQRSFVKAGYSVGAEPAHPGFLGPLLESLKPYDRIVLLISSLDGLGQMLRPFMAEVLRAITNGRLVAVMTGEIDSLSLVSDTNPQMREGRLLVVQGLDRDEFDRLLNGCLRKEGLVFDDEDGLRQYIWGMSGGGMPLTMRFLRDIGWHFGCAPGKAIALSDVRDQIEGQVFRGLYRAPAFRRAADLINGDPTSWRDVQQLIDHGSIPVGGHLPSTLEMAGLAVRENRNLRCQSPLIAKFLEITYDALRFGDLYASHGDWKTAMRYYRTGSEKKLVRRRETNELSRLHSVVNAICALMYDVLGRKEGIGEGQQSTCLNVIKTTLTDACVHVLAFSNVTYWSSSSVASWSLNLLEGTPTDDSRSLRTVLLSAANSTNGEIIQVSPTETLLFLGGLRPGQRFAVIVSDVQGPHTFLWRERKQFLSQILRSFANSHNYVVSLMRKQARRELDIGLARSIDAMLHLVTRTMATDERQGVEELTRLISRSWHGLAYRRVVIYLLDSSQLRLQALAEVADENLPKLGQCWEPAPDTPTRDLLRDTLCGGVPQICGQPAHDIRVPERVQAMNLGPFAAVPMLNSRKHGIGVILVERRDGSLSTNSELQDLLFFAGQLAAAVEQAECIGGLQFSLDAVPEATIILDQSLRTEYVSATAAALFGIRAGWRDHDSRGDEIREIPNLLRVATESLYAGSAMQYDVDLGIKKWAAETIATRITDRRGQTAGTLLHIRNYTSLRRTISAIGAIAAADDIPSAKSLLLKAAEELGFAWGRLYVTLPEDSDRLVAEAAFGVSESLAQKIRDRKIVLPPRGTPGNESWVCIDREKTLIFCYRPDLPYGTSLRTRYDLEYITVQNPQAKDELEKRPGEFWVDFPVRFNADQIGKVTLACNEDLLPEEFRLLCQLADLYPRIFDSISAKDRSAMSRADTIRSDAAQKTINAVAHTLKNVLAPLDTVRVKYKMLEASVPALVSLNNKLEGRLATARATIDRVYMAFGPIRPRNLAEFDLLESVRIHLSAKQTDVQFEITSDSPVVLIKADRHNLEAALDELVQNSIDAMPSDKMPAVQLRVSAFEKNLREFIRIIYKDNGPGIPYPFKSRTFKELQTHAHRGARRTDGTGIGLSVVRRIIEEHGGFIREIGKPGFGAEFIIELPRAPSE